MQVTTGFGYYKDINGKVVGKYVFPLGEHPDPITGLTQIEVANQAALDAIQIYVVPLTPAQAFNVSTFCLALFEAFAADSNLFAYYAVLKDLAVFQNFTGMNTIVNALVSANVITTAEQTTLNGILAQQGIVLSTFTT